VVPLAIWESGGSARAHANLHLNPAGAISARKMSIFTNSEFEFAQFTPHRRFVQTFKLTANAFMGLQVG
jgi:hypothetical protein